MRANIDPRPISSYDLEVGDQFVEAPTYTVQSLEYEEVWEVLDVNVDPPNKESKAEYLCLEAQSLRTGRICYFGHVEGCGGYVNDLYRLIK